MYADDMNLIGAPGFIQLVSKANLRFNKIPDWVKANRLIINNNKTSWVFFSNTSKNNEYNLTLIKILGIIFDEKIGWVTWINCERVLQTFAMYYTICIILSCNSALLKAFYLRK